MDWRQLKRELKYPLLGVFIGMSVAAFYGILIPFLLENRFFGYATEFWSNVIVLFLLMLLSLFLWWAIDKVGELYYQAYTRGEITWVTGECNEHTHKLD